MFNNSHKTGSRSGFAGVWIPAFGATQRIRFSSMVTVLPYWELWNCYTQFTRGGKLPDSYDFWRRQALRCCTR